MTHSQNHRAVTLHQGCKRGLGDVVAQLDEAIEELFITQVAEHACGAERRQVPDHFPAQPWGHDSISPTTRCVHSVLEADAPARPILRNSCPAARWICFRRGTKAVAPGHFGFFQMAWARNSTTTRGRPPARGRPTMGIAKASTRVRGTEPTAPIMDGIGVGRTGARKEGNRRIGPGSTGAMVSRHLPSTAPGWVGTTHRS